MKKLVVLILGAFFVLGAHGASQIYQAKKELVAELKILFKNNTKYWELQDPEKVTTFSNPLFQLVDKAYASGGEYQCLYGGWPAKTRVFGGKLYCSHPTVTPSSFYDREKDTAGCSGAQIPCPSVLFGKGVCVSKSRILDAYDTCDQKGGEPYLSDNFGGYDHIVMMEYIGIAEEICREDNPNPNVKQINCESVQEKIQNYKNLYEEVASSQGLAQFIDDPESLAAYCRGRFGAEPSLARSALATVTLTTEPQEETEISEEVARHLCKDLSDITPEEETSSVRPPIRGPAHATVECDTPILEHTGPIDDNIRSLNRDVMAVVARLERDRREENGADTQEEIFRLANGLFDRQLDVFSDINGLVPAADREDNFLIRTVKDVEMNENVFKRRSLMTRAALDLIIERNEQGGPMSFFIARNDLVERLNQNGMNPTADELNYIRDSLNNVKSKFNENWSVFRALPPAGSAASRRNQLEKLKTIRAIASKALDDDQQLEADEFYYYSFFIPSRKQQTTTFVQPEDGGPYLPFKESREIGGGRPTLSQAPGSKLFQGDVKQPEGFMRASWGHASANVTDSGKWLYYRAHVNYGNDVSERERERLRSDLRASGMRGGRGGAIRIHADVGSLGCLELPIEDSVGVTGLTRDGNNPDMQTIPFEFTPENLSYFGNKIKGHGEFWRSVAEHESDNFRYREAVPISKVLGRNSRNGPLGTPIN